MGADDTVDRAGTGLGWSVAAAGTVTAVFALSNAPTPLYVRWQDEWGFSSGLLTVIFAAYIAGLIATLLVAGRIADRHGRRVVLVPGVLLAVLSSVLFLLAQDVAWLLIARFLAGVAVGAAVTAGMAAVVDLAPARSRRRASLLASTAMVFGAGLGPLVTGLLARSLDRPQVAVFAIMTVVTATGAILAALLPLTHPTPAAQDSERRWRFPSPPPERRRELAWGIATFAPGITATSFVLSLGPSVLYEAVGVADPFLAGVIACAMFLAATGVQFALAHLSTRTHLLLSSLAAITGMVLLGLTVTVLPTVVMLTVAALLAGIAQGLGQLAGLTLIATRIPTARRAESNAALNIAGYIPAALLPVATGYLADATGLHAAVLAFAGVLGLTATIALIAVRAHTSTHLRDDEAGSDSTERSRR
ncbi:MFS transporter [Microbacterium lacticum]|uniref:MFS transporter n=1 Tax=Microbacterium lacticum TaxID=33885 RepID=UPI0018B0A0DD|nr:MFS transporter [Microbacterium lacticum]MBF9334955.1 MFS transporter [Microbacterium lacticum]